MASFCPVCPPQMLQQMFQDKSAWNNHLLLAHDVAAQPTEYRKVLPSRGKWYLLSGLSSFIIMDNSVVELGTADSLECVKKAINAVNTDVVVLPDVYEDGHATTKSTLEAHPIWLKELDLDNYYGCGFMVVPQGKSLKEWAICAESLSHDMEGVCWWGIPRNLVKWIGTRKDAIEIARALNPQRGIHMLGFSDDLIDDVLCARNPHVNTIDSAVPIRAASIGRRFELTMHLPPRGDWWQNGVYASDLTTYNVDKVRRLLQG